jgi:hypothetical protein
MSFTMTRTVAETFTLTHAKYLASKVTTDMLRCQQSYGRPTNSEINDYGTELALMLRDGYVAEYEFGFKREEQRIITFHYTVVNGTLNATDDRPGKIKPGVDITNARFFNFMTYSMAWAKMTKEQIDEFRKQLPFSRGEGEPPTNGSGHWVSDLAYSSTGVTLNRRTFQPH